MSFKNANLPRQRWVGVLGNTQRNYDTITALINASRQNGTISIEAADFGEDGKPRILKVNYYALDCDPVGDCADTVCDAGTNQEPKQIYFEPKRCIASKVKRLDVDDLKWVDDGGLNFSDHARAQIMSMFPAVRKELARQIDALLVANIGLLPDGTTDRRVAFANSTNGVVNPTGKFEIERLFVDGNYQMPYILGGAQEIYLWQRSLAASNGQGGFDPARIGMDNVYYDGTVNEVFGDGKQHIIAFDPSVLKFVTWSQNRGIFATDLNNVGDIDQLFERSLGGSIHGAFVDPVTGLVWDFDAKYFDCGGKNNRGYFQWQLRLYWDIIFLPEANCNLQGVNGIFHFTACDPVLPPCPTGDPIPAAPVASVFEWTPGAGTVPRFIHALTIAGVATEPNVNAATLADLVAIMNANSPMVFTLEGSTIKYTGFSAITGTINGGAANGGVDVVFAAAEEEGA